MATRVGDGSDSALPRAALTERVLEGHRRMGSGIVRVVGPPCSGKTTAILRLLASRRPVVRSRVEEVDASTAQNGADGGASRLMMRVVLPVYVTIDAVRDAKELTGRLLAELDAAESASRVTGASSIGEALMRRCAQPPAASGKPPVELHLVLDHVDSHLSAIPAVDIGSLAARWYAAAGYPRNATVWLISTTDIPVPHASRLALLPGLESTRSVAGIRRMVNNSHSRGAAVAEVAAFLAESTATRSSVAVSDPRRLRAAAESVVALLPDADATACAAGKAATRAKVIVHSFAEAAARIATGGAADGADGTGAGGGVGTNVLPLPAQLLVVATFICGALTPAQTDDVLGDGASSARRSSRRSSGGPIAKAAVPNTIGLERLGHVYEHLASLYVAATKAALAKGHDVVLQQPPPAAVAMHHLGALENHGVLRRSPHNLATYKCLIGLDECVAVAQQLRIDVNNLLPV